MKLDKDVLKIAADTAKAHIDTLSAHVAAATKPEEIDAEKVSKHLTDATGALAVAQKHVDETTGTKVAGSPAKAGDDKKPEPVKFPTGPSASGTSVLLTPEAPKASSRLPLYVAGAVVLAAVIASIAHNVYHVAF